LDAAATPANNPKSKIKNQKLQDGVFFVALAGVASVDHLVSTIAAALDFTFYGSADPKTQLLDHLRSRSMLLVLDNFEHLLDGAELISEILGASPASKVLATSRESLNLREEWLHPLSGMSFPDDRARLHGVARIDLTQYTAVQLFVQCARQVQPGFDLVTESEAVANICRLVEGMPLGIELAATWLKFYPCAHIAQEITRNLDFLATRLRNVSPRHRSMKAVFEHSWGLLVLEEQEVFRRLAVFRGGFSPEAAAAVADAPLPLLLTFVEKSLLQLTSAHRFQLHELLRQFGDEKLHSDPTEAERVQDRHCRYYCAWLDQQEVHLKGSGHLTAMSAIEREIENVRAAWEWAVAQELIDELGLAIESLSYFHVTRCWYEQGVLLFRRAAERFAAQQIDDRRFLFARLLTKQAEMQKWMVSDMGHEALREPTIALYAQAFACLQAYRETLTYGDVLWEKDSLRPPDYRQSVEELRLAALAIFEQHNDAWRMAWALSALGFWASLSGHHERAIHCYERGIALCHQIGDQRVLGDILNVYGEARRALGEYEEAMRLAQAGMAARKAVGNKRGIAFSLYLLGDLAWRMGDNEQAVAYSTESRDLFAEIGLSWGMDLAINNLGNIACSVGRLDEARRHYAMILQSKLAGNALATSNSAPWALVGMAEVLRQEQQPEAAIELIEQALRHPNAWQEAKDRAVKLLAALQAILPPAVVAAAQARGRTADLRATVVRLIGVTPA
jgi:predicted ATPase